MANWTARTLLDHVQELLGEPPGAFYNISTRLGQMNQAQRELVDETRALTDQGAIVVVSGTRTYTLPLDFLTFDREAPTFLDSAGNRSTVRVVDPAWLDAHHPQWQNTLGHTGTPSALLLRNDAITLYPTPSMAGTLTLPYVVDPDELTEMADEPFNGLLHLNRFAPALAYHVAFVATISRAPQLAAMFRDLYDRQERVMRHTTRSNPQRKSGVRPGTGE